MNQSLCTLKCKAHVHVPANLSEMYYYSSNLFISQFCNPIGNVWNVHNSHRNNTVKKIKMNFR